MAMRRDAAGVDRHFWRSLPARSVVADIAIATATALILFSAAATPLQWVVLIVMAVALTVRRLSPPGALLIAWAAAITQMAAGDPPLAIDLPILAILYATAAHGDRITRWLGLASAGVGSIVGAAYIAFVLPVYAGAVIDSSAPVGDRVPPGEALLVFVFAVVAFLGLLGLSWTLGLLMRTVRRARQARLDARMAHERDRYDVAVEQERTRIARDMHDVVAHSLAVVIAQADGARYADRGRSDASAEALETIARTARTALGDVRQLLSSLRHTESERPQPTIADIDALAEEFRSAGMDLRVNRSGEPLLLGAAPEMAAYRVTQESLTNALRHGRAASQVELHLDWMADALRVRVANGRLETPPGSEPIGHGLYGMRERVALAGGSLTAEGSGSRFLVTAVIPAAPQADAGDPREAP